MICVSIVFWNKIWKRWQVIAKSNYQFFYACMWDVVAFEKLATRDNACNVLQYIQLNSTLVIRDNLLAEMISDQPRDPSGSRPVLFQFLVLKYPGGHF